MEFNQKLQELRKQKAMTQEELASALMVSRTAVSKWESGRGYPSIDSLKEISRFFAITIDDLLWGAETPGIGQKDCEQRENTFRDLIFGLMDCSTASFFVLPLFRQNADSGVQAVSLLQFTGTSRYLVIACSALVIACILCGLLTLALQNWHHPRWKRIKSRLSILLSAVGVLLFSIGLHPYAAVVMFLLLIIKSLSPFKRT